MKTHSFFGSCVGRDDVLPFLRTATFAVLAIVAPLSSPAQPTYSITVIPIVGNEINDSGQIVGTVPRQNPLFNDAVRLTGTTLESVGMPGTGTAINASGDVVGTMFDFVGNGKPEGHRGFRASLLGDPAGGIKLGTLDILDGTSTSFAFGINATGQIAGHSARSSTAFDHAFRYSDATGMQDLGHLGGGMSSGRAINDNGQVAGYSTISTGAYRAFRYSDDKGMQDLGTLGGDSYGEGINASGQVVGYSKVSPDAAANTHAFVFSDATGMRDLGTLGGTSSWARAINDRGDVVGSSYAGAQPVHRAFLYTGGIMYALENLLAGGVGNVGNREVGFWELNEAKDINNSGQIIGTGKRTVINTDRNGTQSLVTKNIAFLLTPVAVSNHAPTIESDPAIVIPLAPPSGAKVRVRATVSDPDAGQLLVLFLRKGETELGAKTVQTPATNALITFDEVTLTPGVHALTIEVSDGAGGVAEYATTVTVNADTTAPTFSIVPPNQTVNATSASGATVSFPPATATDAGGVVTITYSTASGAVFPIGETTVTVTATDPAGNVATTTFTVFVKGASEQSSDLTALVKSLPLKSTEKFVLQVPLSIAKYALQQNQPRAAYVALRAFEDLASALRKAKKLTEAQAAQLIAESQRIRATIGI